ncbi:MAG: S8 family serine peptidase [Trueperaceae bacterium]|nr:S8 family serine peptidase [Trueperaceae bacterium]
MDDSYYIAQVAIGAGESEAEISAKYMAKVLLFKPEDGFAILGMSKEVGELSLLYSNRNQKSLMVAEASASYSAGWRTWAGGWRTWAGGESSLSYSTFYENQANWNLIHLNEAQNRAKQLGKGITVAILDTGFDLEHPALKNNLSPRASWKDFVDGDQQPEESFGYFYGHGTAVAGIVLQIAPQVTLLPIRVLNGNGEGDLSDVILAIDWAVQQGAQIINLSLGSKDSPQAMRAIIDYAFSKGVYITAATGNAGTLAIDFPASEGNKLLSSLSDAVVSVGSTNSKGKRSSFSNYGSSLDIFAPGEALRTLYPNNLQARVSGTSFATPIASAALALALAEPASKYQRRTGLFKANPANDLDSTANTGIITSQNLFDLFTLGKGMIDLDSYLRAALSVW